jgi:hypothetical protein
MNQFSNFSSLPPNEEATFAVYEERVANASKAGVMFGAIAGIGLGFLVIVISMTVKPEKAGNYSADPGSQTQKASTVKADTGAPTPTPPAAAAPAAETPPPAEAPAPAAGEAPPAGKPPGF